TNAGEFVYVVAWDIDGYNMFIGDFLINESQRVFTNKTDWEYVIGSGDSPRASFDPPPLSTLQSDIARGGWTLPTTSADQPSSPWTTFVPAISPKAQFIWADNFGSASTASRNSYVIFRIKTPVPAVGLPGFTVFLDQNQNGRLDSFERSTTTDAQGNYAFKGLIPATYYVSQATQAGLRLTRPAEGFYTLNIVGGQSLTRMDFTNTESIGAEIRGMKFNDINGDGIRPIDNPPSNATVTGTSDPWLAGMPAGSTASSGDVAPAQSPIQVNGVPIVAGSTLTFQATGSVNYVPSPSGDPPDGNGIFIAHSDGAENGISQVIAIGNSLMAVFLGADQPSLTPAPSTLDFRPFGNVVGGIDYLTLTPKLKQVFFIGNGLTQSGQKQEITVPDGATRLFLGTMDGAGWFNNFGTFSVTVTGTSLEPGLKDWRIFLDQNSNGSIDTGEPSTLTDADGNYSFTNLSPGTFTVAEVSTPPTVVAGATWIQTAPATKTHQITVVAGEIRRRIDFGNQNLGALNHSPKLTSKALTQGDVGTRYLYQAKASDEDGDRLKFDLSVKPLGMAIDPNSGIIFWIPTADQLGTQNVILRVSDGRGGVDLQSFQVLVEALNHPPVITSQPPGPAVANLPYQYRIRAQDSNGDPITFRLKSNPIGDMKVDAT
ncbi:MAG TPA: putative Ig domain-containing protein, partial [Pirellula sp.]|nr:putative Ig domain-containing protein [Pirellula sp.]